MELYQKRVIAEAKELLEKMNLLDLFIKSSEFKLLPKDEVRRLIRQHLIMTLYFDVLGERIGAFNGTTMRITR